MSIEVTVRHMDAKGGIQDYARSKAEMLIEDFPRVEYVHVILDVEKHRCIAEVLAQAKKHVRVEAKEMSDDMKASIDLAVYKVERQLRKLSDRSHDHKTVMKKAETKRQVMKGF
ncbi:MAG: ribosome-associated translation inhibitor RaiA [Kiritimatiellae bacterium]|nr:ribosome-associated translation inhibitor RaiA [Kiritimatiellia bacterium]MDD5520230.1 ribosome-associated translation inhibitor RaiA [Kiritimatiellia bacterium]